MSLQIEPLPSKPISPKKQGRGRFFLNSANSLLSSPRGDSLDRSKSDLEQITSKLRRLSTKLSPDFANDYFDTVKPISGDSYVKQEQYRSQTLRFKPGHKKSQSLGANYGLLNNMINGSSVSSVNDASSLRRCLIDDSVIGENDLMNHNRKSSEPAVLDKARFEQMILSDLLEQKLRFDSDDTDSNARSSSSRSSLEGSENVSTSDDSDSRLNNDFVYCGYIQRKTINKDGRKPAISSWQRFWLVLRGTSIVFFPAKSLRGFSRSDFKSSPSKCISLDKGWTAEHCESNIFLLSDVDRCNIYKFKTNNVLEAISWCREINGRQ